MKDTRFTELVNLYVDRQISPEEQAELELEIQSNPQRRRIYQQYCRMHRATKLVYESFRAHAEQETGVPARPASIARIDERRRARTRWAYAAGTLAAAACLTFVVSRMNFTPNTGDVMTREISAAMTTPAAPAVAVAPAPAANSPARTDAVARPGFVSLRDAEADYATMLAAVRQEEQRLISLGQPGPGPRLSLFDDGVFDDRRLLPVRPPNAFTGRSQRTQVEFTAFQFQR